MDRAIFVRIYTFISECFVHSFWAILGDVFDVAKQHPTVNQSEVVLRCEYFCRVNFHVSLEVIKGLV
jgi:hypothetical protein